MFSSRRAFSSFATVFRSLSSDSTIFKLKKSEKTVAVIAGVSMIVGYVAVKTTTRDLKRKSVRNETVSGMATQQDTQDEKFVPRPLVVAGPSGSGKSTLLKQLFGEFPQSFGFSVSHTTRKPRAGEVDGKDYHYVTREVMEKEIAEGKFIESAEFSSNMYGTSKKAVSDVCISGRICVLDIDMQGVRSVKQTDLNPVYVLIKPPSLEVLEQRLRGRKSDTEEAIQQRLQAARGELDYATQPGMFDHVVVNDTVDSAYAQLKALVIEDVEKLQRQKTN